MQFIKPFDSTSKRNLESLIFFCVCTIILDPSLHHISSHVLSLSACCYSSFWFTAPLHPGSIYSSIMSHMEMELAPRQSCSLPPSTSSQLISESKFYKDPSWSGSGLLLPLNHPTLSPSLHLHQLPWPAFCSLYFPPPSLHINGPPLLGTLCLQLFWQPPPSHHLGPSSMPSPQRLPWPPQLKQLLTIIHRNYYYCLRFQTFTCITTY